jgi:hypothetical protein
LQRYVALGALQNAHFWSARRAGRCFAAHRDLRALASIRCGSHSEEVSELGAPQRGQTCLTLAFSHALMGIPQPTSTTTL